MMKSVVMLDIGKFDNTFFSEHRIVYCSDLRWLEEGNDAVLLCLFILGHAYILLFTILY